MKCVCVHLSKRSSLLFFEISNFVSYQGSKQYLGSSKTETIFYKGAALGYTISIYNESKASMVETDTQYH